MSESVFNPGLLPVTAIAVGTAIASISYAYLAPTSRIFLPVVSRGGSTRPVLALTFDDGPTPGGSEPILDILGERGVAAAFFVIGSNVRRYPHLVERMHSEGHLVCNHSFDHLRLGAFRTPAFWRDQLSRTDEAIEEVIGRRPAFFRAPLGHKSPSMRSPLRESGKVTVGWTRRAFDGVRMSAGLIVHRLSHAGAGEVLLMHDGREPGSRRDPGPTIAALPPLISRIRGRGLECERVDRVLGLEPYLPARAGAGVNDAASRED